MRLIELSSDIKEKPGYFEILGLAGFEKKGNIWFMIIKNNSVVPLCNPQPRETLFRVNVDISEVNQGKVTKDKISLT